MDPLTRIERQREAILTLKSRVRDLDSRYRDSFPRWNNRDYMALQQVLHLIDGIEHDLMDSNGR